MSAIKKATSARAHTHREFKPFFKRDKRRLQNSKETHTNTTTTCKIPDSIPKP